MLDLLVFLIVVLDRNDFNFIDYDRLFFLSFNMLFYIDLFFLI